MSVLKYRIRGMVEDLETGLMGDAEVFGRSPEWLAEVLRPVAVDYVILLTKHAASRTRGAVLNDIAYVAQGGEETVGRRLGVLDGEAFDAVLGGRPNASLKLHGIDGYDDIYVPGRAELEISAFKKMIGARARLGAPTLFKAEFMRTGLEPFAGGDRATVLERLKNLAQSVPDVMLATVRQAETLLKRTFQVTDDAGGRNAKVIAGQEPPPDWVLIDRVLDIVWPIGNGSMHASKMKHARNIVDQVILYARGTEARAGQSAKRSNGLITLADEDDDKIDRRHLFDNGWFSSILTYRHQINTLSQAVEFLDRRKMAFNEIPSPRPESVVKRHERLDRVAYYPLRDWLRELERRLREADYRTADESVRRPTGAVFAIPDVPKLRSDMPQALIALKLIHAWRDYKGRKEPPNKGVRKKPASKGKKPAKAGKLKLPIKNISLRRLSGR